MPIKGGTKEYDATLALLYASVKSRTLVRNRAVQRLLCFCPKELSVKRNKIHTLTSGVQPMLLASCVQNGTIAQYRHYQITLIPPFANLSRPQDYAFNQEEHKQEEYKQDGNKQQKERAKGQGRGQEKPQIYHFEILSKKPLRPYSIVLVKIPNDYMPNQRLSSKHLHPIFRIFFERQHSLHALIIESLKLAGLKLPNLKNLNAKAHPKHTKRQKAQIQGEVLSSRICVLKMRGSQVVAHAFDSQAIIPIQATQKSLKELPPYTLIRINAQNEITEVLGTLLEGRHDKAIAMNANYYEPTPFSPEAQKEAQNSIDSLNDMQGIALPPHIHTKPFDTTARYDITNLPFCTIDPINAKDHDDAIYYDSKAGILYVAIADVSSYVFAGSNLDKEAKQNAFSLYFPNQVFPMLPPSLSANACSLKPNARRLALVWALRLHKRSAKILHAQVFQAIICSQAALNYKQVAQLLDNPNQQLALRKTHSNICESLLAFSKLAQILFKKRTKEGVELLLQDFQITLDHYEHIKYVSLRHKSSAHTLVEEAMLLANRASANYLSDMGHGIYRNHAPPSKRDYNRLIHILEDMQIERTSAHKAKDSGKDSSKDTKQLTKIQAKKLFQDSPKEVLRRTQTSKITQALQLMQKKAQRVGQRGVVDFCIVRHFNKAVYGVRSIGHFGLGFLGYTHFTSPIRRYSDLIVHRLITAKLQHKPKLIPFIMREAEDALAHINKREVQFDSIEWQYKRLKMLRYAQSILPFCDEALVLDCRNGMANGFPLHKVGYCNVSISCKDLVLNAPMIIQIRVINVDFNTMSLQAIPLCLDTEGEGDKSV